MTKERKKMASSCATCFRIYSNLRPLAILTSFNRNFKSRNDGNRLTMNFLASPTIVTAMAFSGKLSFNPMSDFIELPSGESFMFSPPVGQDLPSSGFIAGNPEYYPKPSPEPQIEVPIVIKPDSQRLELLEPFPSHFGPESGNPRGLEMPPLTVLMRVRGKCTTDHISAAVSMYSNATKKSLNKIHCPLGPMAKIQRAPHKHLGKSL